VIEVLDLGGFELELLERNGQVLGGHLPGLLGADDQSL
jgi:hypothetical protein